MLGICNGFQVLCEAGLLPGALLPNQSLRFVCRQVGIEVADTDTAFTRACARGRRALDPGQAHDRPLLRARRPVRVVFRYARGVNPNGSQEDIAGVANAAGNVVGLMPHPEHAVDLLHGSQRRPEALRLGGPRRACLRPRLIPAVEHAVALGLTRDEYALVVREARPRAQRGRAGDVLPAVERALRLQALQEAAAHAADRGPERVVMGPGENAGAVDVGGGWAIAFKVESHNHPSAVEPFQGAATGVGGILRDIFAIGARPIAVLDSLRFGEPDSERSRYLLDRAVAGHRPLRQLASACRPSAARSTSRAPTRPTAWSTRWRSGSHARDDMIRSAAAGVGNVVVLFGASTGRDGIGGASVLASRRARRRGRVQAPVGPGRRPVRGEQAAIECSLELLEPRACSSRCRTSARPA